MCYFKVKSSRFTVKTKLLCPYCKHADITNTSFKIVIIVIMTVALFAVYDETQTLRKSPEQHEVNLKEPCLDCNCINLGNRLGCDVK